MTTRNEVSALHGLPENAFLPDPRTTSLISQSRKEKNVDVCDAYMGMSVTVALDVAEDTCRRSTMDWERTGIDLSTHRFGCPSYHPSAKAENRATVKDALTYMDLSSDNVCGSGQRIRCSYDVIWYLEGQLSFPPYDGDSVRQDTTNNTWVLRICQYNVLLSSYAQGTRGSECCLRAIDQERREQDGRTLATW